MVGTRRPSAYGRQAAFDLSLAMAQAGAVIVSGLADGLEGNCKNRSAGKQFIKKWVKRR